MTDVKTRLAMTSVVTHIMDNNPGLGSPSPIRYPKGHQTPRTG